MILVIAVAADIMVFSRISALPLIATAAGTAMILLGIEYSYRPASLAGLLAVVIAAASSVEIPTLLELGMILTALIALLIPVLLLIWLALSAEEGEEQQVSLMTKPGAISLGYALACLWAVPIALLIVSLLTPTLSMRITIITEAAIILIATIAGGILLTRRRPAITKPPVKEEQSAKG